MELYNLDRLPIVIQVISEQSIVFYPSKCHQHPGDWVPELESPAHERLAVRVRIAKAYKMHWLGSPCLHVSGKFAFLNAPRHLTKAEFKSTPKDMRCENCMNHFSA